MNISNFTDLKGFATLVCAGVAGTLAFSSCINEDGFMHEKQSLIGVAVSSVHGAETKAGVCADIVGCEVIDSFAFETPGDEPLTVTAYSSDYDELPFDLSDLTKSSVNTSSTLNQNGRSFVINAWLGAENRKPAGTADGDNYHFIKNMDVTCNGSGEWSMASYCYWRDGVPTTFWSYYPKTLGKGSRTITWPGDKASDAEQAKIQFSYTLPAATDAKKDAEPQEDLLFAYNHDSWTEDSVDDVVDIDFYHALSAIRFDISGIPEGVTISQIYLKDIPPGGTCNVSPDADGKLQFAWTPSTTKTTFRQSFSSADFTQESGNGTANSLQGLSSSKTFFLVPQTIKGAGVKMGITYQRSNGTVATVEQVLNHDISWNAGKVYTYKIGTDADKVDVEILESVSGDVKSNVMFKNTGNTKVWIRARLVGNWYDSDGNIVENWSESDTASGSFEGFPGTDWINKDGIYYYTKVVDPYSISTSTGVTSALFTKYTRKNDRTGHHLELNVLVQAVEYSNSKTYETVWDN